MRLLYVTRGYNLHDERLLCWLLRKGVSAGLVSLGEPRTRSLDCEQAGNVTDLGQLSPVYPRTTPRLLNAVPNFKRIVEAYCPDVILAGPVHDAAYVALKAAVGSPVVAQSWAFDVLWEVAQSSAVPSRSRFALSHCAGLFADSKAVAQRCVQFGLSSETPVLIMPWGIDQAAQHGLRPRATVRRELGFGPHDFAFLHARQLEPIYGIPTLMAAFATLVRRHERARLVMASSGTLRDWVTAWLARQPALVRRSVNLVGSVPQRRLCELYRACDGYVACSESDGTSIALLQAMQYGLLPIVSRVGGNPEWIAEGFNGWLAPVRNARAYANCMQRAMRLSPLEGRRIKQRNRLIVKTRADLRTNAQRLIEFLASIAQRDSVAKPPTDSERPRSACRALADE